MKRRTRTRTLLLLCAGGIVPVIASAADKTGPAGKPEAKPVLMTGSYIPHKIKTTQRITDGSLNVTIIDRAAVEASGAGSVAQILAKEPGIQLRRR